MSAKSTVKKTAAGIADADSAVAETFDDSRQSRPVELLAIASELGDQPQLRLISGAVLAAGLLGGNPRLIRAGARMLIAHELATAAKNFVKRRVDRKRPRSADTRDQSRPRPGRHTAKEITSFPSGHTAGALAVARAFAREFPEHRGPALAAAGLVAVAQIPRCAHYPSDVGAGALIGGAAEGAVALVWPGEEGDETRRT
jgi:membrane-associated phospholipid phosphatase